ncbi:hypothetical protein PAXRUDRAFT_17958 [Paxillus rubicundulus Ve08.2h10]|uniref:Uncharacterized protein n=1 Tax=Paxillus rubicundulus Ve08.2h10 TaxID=930991 RepID=A0A0D0DG11_9AGAM|nr:hypothetical protein PAXRUDRAFT_17958 [Paxillus rubicundulus Ve08.2h10]
MASAQKDFGSQDSSSMSVGSRGLMQSSVLLELLSEGLIDIFASSITLDEIHIGVGELLLSNLQVEGHLDIDFPTIVDLE